MNTPQEIASHLLPSKNLASIGGRKITTTSAIAVVLSLAIVLFEVLPMGNAIYATTRIMTRNTISTTTSSSSSLLSSLLSTTTMMTQAMKSPYDFIVLYGIRDSHNIALRVSNFSAIYRNSRPRNTTTSNSNNPKFIHSSIRIEQDVLNTLQAEAQRRGVSFSSLVNNTLKNYVTSEMYVERLGLFR